MVGDLEQCLRQGTILHRRQDSVPQLFCPRAGLCPVVTTSAFLIGRTTAPLLVPYTTCCEAPQTCSLSEIF